MKNALTFKTLDLANIVRQAEWPGSDNTDLSFRALEFAGEAGELCNKIKKFVRLQKGIAGTHDSKGLLLSLIRDEIGDVAITLSLLAIELGLDTGDCVVEKFNKTSDKMGLGTEIDPNTGHVS